MAVAFDFIYVSAAASLFELVLKSKFSMFSGESKDKDYNAFDILVALVISYMAITFFPTFATNFVIILKESTMNQFAWSKDQEFQDGTFLGVFNDDLLDLIGVPEDQAYYNSEI